MKIYYFSHLLFQAFKNIAWGKVSQIRQTTNGWDFVITDTLNGDEYVCCAYPVKSEKTVMPNTADQLLQMQDGGDLCG